MNNKTIPIFFTVDDGYSPYVSIAIDSLIDNADKNRNYTIHVIHEDMTEESMAKIKTLETNYAKIEFTEMKKNLEMITNRAENFLRTDFFTLTIYFRIFLPTMFPEYDKAIYIDSDIVVPGDISKLYDIDLEGNLFGGCNDISCLDNEILCEYFEQATGIPRSKYINSGVLLMNMKRLREVKFEEHFLYLLSKYHFDTVCPDQDYINFMAYGNVKILGSEWDAMPTDGKRLIDNPELIHYNLFFKPWHFDNVDYEDVFWKYANRSLFLEDVKKEKASYTKEKQDADMAMLEHLVARAIEVTNADVNFKKVFDAGLETRL